MHAWSLPSHLGAPVNSTVMHSVLVVDDDISLRPMLAAWVNRFGFTAYEAASAEAALQHLEHTPADIALCDVNMPGRDGVWLAGRIREQHPTTAVIMATSVDDADVAVSTLSNDVVDYLLKPFDSTRLREALALGLDWHRASVGDEDLHHVLQSRLRTRARSRPPTASLRCCSCTRRTAAATRRASPSWRLRSPTNSASRMTSSRTSNSAPCCTTSARSTCRPRSCASRRRSTTRNGT